jgi:hypothetical protein
MSVPLDDLRQQRAEEALELAELESVIDLDDEDVPVDHEAAIERLRHEPDDDQPDWRRAS